VTAISLFIGSSVLLGDNSSRKKPFP
jgi:hypothetical protein